MGHSTRRQRLRRWVRAHPQLLGASAVSLVLVVIASVVIVDAARTPVVGDITAPTAPAPSAPVVPTDGTLDPESVVGTGDATIVSNPLSDRTGLESWSTPPFASPPANCGTSTFTLTYASDGPIHVGGYLTSTGEGAYFPQDAGGSVTIEHCATDPAVMVIVQAGSTASTVSCTTAVDGQPADMKSAYGAYSSVTCYA